MRSSFSACLLFIGSWGIAQTTEPATKGELTKLRYCVMQTSAVRYDEKQLTQRAMVYVYNYSDQNLLNPRFEGTLTVGARKYKGAQVDVKLASTIPDSYYGVLPVGLVTNALVTFKFPIESYYYGRVLTVKLAAAQKMKASAPITEANGMRQFLIRSTGPQITQAFKRILTSNLCATKSICLRWGWRS